MKYSYLLTCSVIALTCSQYAVASPLDNTSHTHTQHTLELKPISNLDNAFQTAATVFLPDKGGDYGFNGRDLGRPQDSTPKIDTCPGFGLTSCPANAKCTKCSTGNKYKVSGCNDGYKLSSGSCVAKSCSEINSAYRADVPANQVCSTVSAYGKTCYQSCSAINFSGYPITTCPVNASCVNHPDCATTASKVGNCSPVKKKVSTCTLPSQKLNANASGCINKDDTCPTTYFKSCETGTTGTAKYTELGTACYQCKPKEPECPAEYYTPGSIPQSIFYEDECKDKRSNYHQFSSSSMSNFLHNSNVSIPACSGNCKILTITLNYGKYQNKSEVRYYEPTSAQRSSPEIVVTNCLELETALKNTNNYNIRISGTVTCNGAQYSNQPSEYYASSEKHIYGKNKSTDILEFTHKNVILSAYALRVSNLTFKVLQTDTSHFTGFLNSKAPESYSNLKNDILVQAENVDIIGNNVSLKNNIFFKGGENHLYQNAYVSSSSNGSGTMVIGENAKLYFHGDTKSEVTFDDLFILGQLIPTPGMKISYSTPSSNRYYIEGNNKNYRGEIVSGKMAAFNSWPVTWLYIIGNGSTVSSNYCGSNFNLAIGDNARFSCSMPAYGNGPNVAMGRSSQMNSSRTSGSYGGEYTYITTSDWTNPAKFY